MAKICIIKDPDNTIAIGKTFEEALHNYQNEFDNYEKFSEFSWYEAEEVSVKQHVVKVERTVITKK